MKILKKGIVLVSLVIVATLFTGCSVAETWDVLWGSNKTGDEAMPSTTFDPDAVKVDESVAAPRFSKDLEGSRTYAINDKAEELVVEAEEEAEGEVTYQWYVNTVDSNGGGEQVAGATANAYTPKTDQEGRFYYFVVATHAVDKKINLSTSAIAEIIIDPDQEPEVVQEEATRMDGWVETDEGWQYYDEENQPATNKSMEIEGKNYRFNKEGIMLTGWHKGKTYWYFYNDDGAMAMDTYIEDGGKKYHVNEKGRMASLSWVENGDNTWSYALEDGAIAIGWNELKGDWYYFDEAGVMVQNAGIDGKWLNPDGRLAH